MAYSIATGLIFFASFAGVASGSSQAPIVIGFWIGVVLAFAWIAVMAARLMAGLPKHKELGAHRSGIEQTYRLHNSFEINDAKNVK